MAAPGAPAAPLTGPVTTIPHPAQVRRGPSRPPGTTALAPPPTKVAPQPLTRPPAGPVRPVAPEEISRWQRLAVNPAMSKRWKAGLSALGVLIVLAICGVSSYLIVQDERNGQSVQANGGSPAPTALAVDISSREVDPEPLTIKEVFPSKKIIIDVNRPGEVYTVLATQSLKDCRSATSGAISKLITNLGCSQVIRGTLRSPTGGYLITGGIINLKTVEEAEKAWDEIKPLVEKNKGRFLGYAPDRTAPNSKTRPLALSSTHAGWNIKGHYLVYCVIANAQGGAIPPGDPFAKQILYDMIEIYLRGVVLEQRATDPLPSPGESS